MKKINETFHPIDMTAWERQPYFYYFTKMLPTGYSMTVEMDITETYESIKQEGEGTFCRLPLYHFKTTNYAEGIQDYHS